MSARYVNDCTVCRKSLIGGQQDELLDLRLRHQHPIKRIAMAVSLGRSMIILGV